ncbi:LOW QUALITY PROTEIN: olfactory receptor 2B11-like [Glossophaga mutica]
MRTDNQSFLGGPPRDFILLGVSGRPWLGLPLFLVLLVSYVLAMLGNIVIILVLWLDPWLHSPMYLFFLDLCYTTTTVAQMLANLGSSRKTISCMVQYVIFHWLGCTKYIVLAAMALDRYVAICKPLCYTLIMHRPLCQQLVAIALSSLGNSLIQVVLMVQLPFCGQQVLDNFREVPAMIKLSCADTTVNVVMLAVLVAFFVLVPLALILFSYGFIAWVVLWIQFPKAWHKAVGTCSSHRVVSFIYLLAIYMYLKPLASYSQEQGKFISLFYSIITPTLNPFIYTLRKDVKGGLRELLARFWWLCRSDLHSHSLICCTSGNKGLRGSQEALRTHRQAHEGAVGTQLPDTAVVRLLAPSARGPHPTRRVQDPKRCRGPCSDGGGSRRSRRAAGGKRTAPFRDTRIYYKEFRRSCGRRAGRWEQRQPESWGNTGEDWSGPTNPETCSIRDGRCWVCCCPGDTLHQHPDLQKSDWVRLTAADPVRSRPERKTLLGSNKKSIAGIKWARAENRKQRGKRRSPSQHQPVSPHPPPLLTSPLYAEAQPARCMRSRPQAAHCQPCLTQS